MTKDEKRQKKSEYNKSYYLKNKDVLLEKVRQYRDQNRKQINLKQRAYLERNRAVVNKRKMIAYYENHEENLAKRRSYNKLNRERIRERDRQYLMSNREKIRNQERLRYKMDINSRLARVLRARIRESLKNKTKSDTTEKLIGITIQQLASYLESKFMPGMTWENYGEWEIDHIYPLSKFNLIDHDQQRKAFHYTNLQPMWMSENRQKGAKILN